MTDGDRLDRANVQLAIAKIDALAQLTRAEFTNTQRQLDRVMGLPEIVTGIIENGKRQDDRITAVEAAVENIKKDAERRHDWRISNLPATLIGLAGVLVAIVTLVVTHHG